MRGLAVKQEVTTAGPSGSGDTIGRGALRGTRTIERPTFIRTKPDSCANKQGVTGQKVVCTANYFAIETKADWHLYQYRVDFNPEEDRTMIKRGLLSNHRAQLGGGFVFDGTMLFTHQRLAPDPMELVSKRKHDDQFITMTVRMVDKDAIKYGDQTYLQVLNIVVRKCIANLDMILLGRNYYDPKAKPMELVSKRKHDDQFITMTVRMVDKDAIKYGDQTYLQVLNIVVRKCIANLDMILLGRNYYDPKAKITIPEFSLELWPGYLTSMRQHEHSFLLCVEIIHKVLRKDTAYDLLNSAQQRDSRNYQDIFRNEMIGQVVLTDYGNTATYKVDDVDFTSNPDTAFDMKGVKTTYRDYYYSKYGLKIQDSRQPLLVSRPKARDERGGRDGPIFLVPELCRMTGITDEMRNNQNLMRAMADRTRMDSRTRQERLMVFQKRFTQTPKNAEELKNWNLSLSKNLVSMNSRILPPERVLFGGGNAVTLERGPDWTNNFRNCSLLATSAISNWVVVGLSNAQRDIQEFVSLLQKSARGMGLRIDQPQWMNLDDDRVNSCVGVLDRVLSRDLPQIILFPVSNNRADRYSAIKRKTYVDRAVPSQVVALRTLRKKGLMSIATKVAIQMSCKIGGSPWSVDIPIKSTMVIGYDVCHDAKQKTKSYGALVASLNASWSRYYSSVTHHQHGEEIFKDLPMNIIKAITKYQQHNENQLPNRLLIYRDGVGEGQVNKVFSREVEDVVVVALRTLRKKGLMSIATKVAIQMSCKIGGSPWSVDIPIKSTMVIGYDVCHDAKQKTKSYGALVASLNASWSRYYSSVTHHQHGEEIFKDLPLNIIKAITKYQQHNENQLPNRLLIYRDGVGEGQVNKVFSREVEDVVNALQATYGEQAPKMAFIIVTKRLNSRIFLGNENPPAGTVVDDVITCPEKYDFFLIPQLVRQGTVSPAGYNVIYDKSGLSADHMQRITYKLCHLYFNWSGTVRVPAPCQYAHKLAFLCSQNLHGIPNEDLSDLLYFL
uniref:Aubergine n=1 Tax=Nilaparvata lugens TaxID=108931 RepID=M4QKW4_NILLU|nr:aubergine [Nilaparvata lugens]